MESAPSPPSLVFLVHGEPEASSALAAELERRVGCRTHVAELDEEVDLSGELAKAPRRGEELVRPAVVPVEERRVVEIPADSERLGRTPAYLRADQDSQVELTDVSNIPRIKGLRLNKALAS